MRYLRRFVSQNARKKDITISKGKLIIRFTHRRRKSGIKITNTHSTIKFPYNKTALRFEKLSVTDISIIQKISIHSALESKYCKYCLVSMVLRIFACTNTQYCVPRGVKNSSLSHWAAGQIKTILSVKSSSCESSVSLSAWRRSEKEIDRN